MILDSIHSPADVRELDQKQLPQLCRELRQFLLENVSKTGGHLASNLGVVELTVAIHRVFDTAQDRLVFDVGHQSYVHKALTGRQALFSTLRQLDGLSGFPKPYESVHDSFIAGHASNSVSVALGMARARTLQQENYQVLALIGDGALTGGLAYEGLNNAGASGEHLIVILNDNGMSIDPNVGAIPDHLTRLRSKPAYYHFKKWYRSLFGETPAKSALYRFNHRLKTSLKKSIWPGSTLFEDMGFTSVGPINGHTLATTGYNGFYLITKSGAKTEEDVKACLHFLDKMCDPEMMALADYGLKDICYDINADGKIVPNGKYDTTNCPHAGLNQAVPYVPYLTEQNPDYQLEKADYQLAYEESIANNVQYAVFNPALGYLTQSDTYAECGSDLVQILDDARTQYICGQIDEAGLQAAFDQWNARGGTQVIEEVNALYAADKA